MAPKKKAAAAGDGPDPFEEFKKKYQKLLKEHEGTPKIKEVELICDKIAGGEEDGSTSSWVLTEPFDPMTFRLLMQALATCGPLTAAGHPLGFNLIKMLRMWNCGRPGDEAVRAVCFYLDSPCQFSDEDNKLIELQMTDCGITALGCSFLGRSLGFGGNHGVQCLKLDFNQIGSAGMEQLALGLAQNASLKKLDLNYCGIDGAGGKSLFEILIYVKSSLESLELRGNELGKVGMVDVMRGARRAKKLKKLDVADNKFEEEKEVIDGFLDLFAANTTLEHYDLVGNGITDAGAEKLIRGMFSKSHLKKVLIPPDKCSAKCFEALETALGVKKGGKAKKKKGK
jgi:hypothetical protein